MVQRRILIIEDDPAIRRGLVDAIEFAGFATIACGDGNEGLERALATDIDLMVLDVMLPGRSGFELLREVRRARSTLPVVMVTAKGQEADRVLGLELGADDYVVKPFSAKELLARIEAVLRRSAERPLDIAVTRLGRCRVDLARREVTQPSGKVHGLTDREVEILRYLIASPDRIISRDELLQSVWGLKPSGLRHTRTVDMHIARLREKLDDDSAPSLIATVRGKGYMVRRSGSPEDG